MKPMFEAARATKRRLVLAEGEGGKMLQACQLIVSEMGQGPSPVRARPGALGFWRALGPTLREGLKPGPGPGPWSKAWGLKGLLEYDFPLENWHYFGKV